MTDDGRPRWQAEEWERHPPRDRRRVWLTVGRIALALAIVAVILGAAWMTSRGPA